MTTPTKFEVLDPTVEPIPAHAVVARRPKTLDGAVLGLLANAKRNSDVLLDQIHDIMADRYDFKEVVVKNKGNASRPCPGDIMDELVQKCDVVITASGD